jgi:NADPH2:quinone reductase
MGGTARVSNICVVRGCSLVNDIDLRLFASGRIKPILYDKIFSLDEVAVGLDALEKRRTWGKVIVRIKDEKQRIVAKL